MPRKRREFTQTEKEKLVKLYVKEGASRTQIARILHMSHDRVQEAINNLGYEEKILHNDAVKGNMFDDRQRHKISGRPASNYRKQREIEQLKDNIKDSERFFKLRGKLSPTLYGR